MASIKKRRGTYSVVYSYENDKGEKKQRWETFKTYAEAHKRRAEIEYLSLIHISGQIQLTICLENGDKISLEDADVQAIIASITPSK